MTSSDPKQRVFDVLARREQIAVDTRRQLEETRGATDDLDPLAQIDPAVRRAAEDEFYAAKGRHRYETSDGRTLFLTPEEIDQRRRSRGQRKKQRGRSVYEGSGAADARRKRVSLAFYVGAIALALVLTALILG